MPINDIAYYITEAYNFVRDFVFLFSKYYTIHEAGFCHGHSYACKRNNIRNTILACIENVIINHNVV